MVRTLFELLVWQLDAPLSESLLARASPISIWKKEIRVKVDKSRRKCISRSCIVIQRHLLPSARRWCENIKRTCERVVETASSRYERGNKVRRGVVPKFGIGNRKRIDPERYVSKVGG